MTGGPLVALEIGTSRVVALVGEPREDGALMITGQGECVSAGIRKGEVIDFDHALACARGALQAAEEQGNLVIRKVHLVLSGADIASDVNRATVHVLNDEREIRAAEIAAVTEAARRIPLPAEREVLHSVQQQFQIDSNGGIVNPEGMEGAQLSLDMLVIHGRSGALRNAIKVVRSVPMDVEDVAFGGLCSALAVLTRDQKAGGVLAIDLGGGTTDYLVYANQYLALAGSLSVGGDHVTNDLALGLRVPNAQAERLKTQHGSAVIAAEARQQSVALPAEGGFAGRTVRLADVQAIIHARMDETFRMIRTILERRDLLGHLAAGVVLTGGGAQMEGILPLAERVFNLPCAIGRPRGVSGLSTVTNVPSYAAPIGMLKYAMQTGPAAGAGSVLQWFRDILSRTARGGGHT
jgi:cell division protein FtsA